MCNPQSLHHSSCLSIMKLTYHHPYSRALKCIFNVGSQISLFVARARVQILRVHVRDILVGR